MRVFKLLLAGVSLACMLLCSCNSIDDDRIPDMPVAINLSTPDLWTTYGVADFGSYRMFIRQLSEPRNFPYNVGTTTGYGGVLLISAVDPFNGSAVLPMAYDLSCPVECKPDIRVRVAVDDMLPFAVCPDCGSHYDIMEQAGAPTYGPAKSRKLGLRRYDCYATQYGGYIIANSN